MRVIPTRVLGIQRERSSGQNWTRLHTRKKSEGLRNPSLLRRVLYLCAWLCNHPESWFYFWRSLSQVEQSMRRECLYKRFLVYHDGSRETKQPIASTKLNNSLYLLTCTAQALFTRGPYRSDPKRASFHPRCRVNPSEERSHFTTAPGCFREMAHPLTTYIATSP